MRSYLVELMIKPALIIGVIIIISLIIELSRGYYKYTYDIDDLKIFVNNEKEKSMQFTSLKGPPTLFEGSCIQGFVRTNTSLLDNPFRDVLLDKTQVIFFNMTAHVFACPKFWYSEKRLREAEQGIKYQKSKTEDAKRDWFVVSFDENNITISVSPKREVPFKYIISWESIGSVIGAVCFRIDSTPDMLLEFGGYPVIIPKEVDGGYELWNEILRRKNFKLEDKLAPLVECI